MVGSVGLCSGRDRSFCCGFVEDDVVAVWDPGTKPGSTPAEVAPDCLGVVEVFCCCDCCDGC